MTTLSELQEEQTAVIDSFNGGEKMLDRMIQHGIYPGDTVTLLRTAPLKGPYLISIDGREIIVGRSIAKKILVKLTE